MPPYVTDILAVSRITRLITEDEITRPIREAIVGRKPEGQLAYLITCPLCVSVWVGAAVALSDGVRPIARPRAALLRMLALSEATIALRKALPDG